MAAHDCSGKVIAQVKRVTAGEFEPPNGKGSGIMVDGVVVDEQIQATDIGCDPAVSGDSRSLSRKLIPFLWVSKPSPHNGHAWSYEEETSSTWGRRPSFIASVAAEEDLVDQVAFTIEHGAVGGVPLTGLQVGAAVNAEGADRLRVHVRSCHRRWNYYAAPWPSPKWTARETSMSAVSTEVPIALSGTREYMDILHSVKRIVFSGTLTARGSRER